MGRAWVPLVVIALLVGACTSDPVQSEPSSSATTTIGEFGPVLENAPGPVQERSTLFYCGAHAADPLAAAHFEEFALDDASLDCFDERVAEGLPVEVIVVGFTVEGDAIVSIVRRTEEGRVEVYMDTTRDAFGDQGWLRFECNGYDTFGRRTVGCGDAAPVGL